MKRRSERVRLQREQSAHLQRLSVVSTNGLVGKATSSEPVGKAEEPVVKAGIVPIYKVEKPTIEKHAVSVPLLLFACCIWLVGLGVNGWYNWNLGTKLPDKVLLSSLGLFCEGTIFFLPDQANALWISGRWITWLGLCLFVFVVSIWAVFTSVCFMSENITETTRAKAEKVTQEVSDAIDKLNDLISNRDKECGDKRGQRGRMCHQLEEQVQQARQEVKQARDKVSATADTGTTMTKVVSWVSGLFGYQLNPSADDFAMLRILVVAILLNSGWFLKMVAKK